MTARRWPPGPLFWSRLAHWAPLLALLIGMVPALVATAHLAPGEFAPERLVLLFLTAFSPITVLALLLGRRTSCSENSANRHRDLFLVTIFLFGSEIFWLLGAIASRFFEGWVTVDDWPILQAVFASGCLVLLAHRLWQPRQQLLEDSQEPFADEITYAWFGLFLLTVERGWQNAWSIPEVLVLALSAESVFASYDRGPLLQSIFDFARRGRLKFVLIFVVELIAVGAFFGGALIYQGWNASLPMPGLSTCQELTVSTEAWGRAASLTPASALGSCALAYLRKRTPGCEGVPPRRQREVLLTAGGQVRREAAPQCPPVVLPPSSPEAAQLDILTDNELHDLGTISFLHDWTWHSLPGVTIDDWITDGQTIFFRDSVGAIRALSNEGKLLWKWQVTELAPAASKINLSKMGVDVVLVAQRQVTLDKENGDITDVRLLPAPTPVPASADISIEEDESRPFHPAQGGTQSQADLIFGRCSRFSLCVHLRQSGELFPIYDTDLPIVLEPLWLTVPKSSFAIALTDGRIQHFVVTMKK